MPSPSFTINSPRERWIHTRAQHYRRERGPMAIWSDADRQCREDAERDYEREVERGEEAA